MTDPGKHPSTPDPAADPGRSHLGEHSGATGAPGADAMAKDAVAGSTDEQITGHRARTARSAVIAIFLAALLCVLFAGDSITPTAESMPEGTARTVVEAVGKPAGRVAEALPFASAADAIADWFRDDADATAPGATPAGGKDMAAGGRDDAGAGDGGAAALAGGATGADVAPEAFDRRTVDVPGGKPVLSSALVTGDSMALGLDSSLARSLARGGVKVARDARLGTGISMVEPVDWTTVPAGQLRAAPAEVVVMLIGANEGFPLRAPGGDTDADCCTADWAAAYGSRVRAILRSYLSGGVRHVLWLALPAPQDARRQPITRAVNGAVREAARPFGARVTVLATDEYFTPGGRFRAAMPVGGRTERVRDADGVHLSERGSELAATLVQEELGALYRLR